MPPDDITDPPTDQGTPRVVWRGETPMVAVEEDGVVSLHRLRTVPDALWNCPYWQHLALPDWASNIADPSGQFLAIAIHLAGQKQDTIDVIKAALTDLRAVRKRIAMIDAKDVVAVDEVGIRLRNLVEDLDK